MIELEQFAVYLVTAVLGAVFLVAAERARMKRSMWTANRQMLGAEISIIVAGAFAGAVILFFGGGLFIVGLVNLGFRSSFPTFDAWIVTSFTVGAIAGAFAGYLVFRRSRYSKPAYYNPFAT